jgi:hypothetical protein
VSKKKKPPLLCRLLGHRWEVTNMAGRYVEQECKRCGMKDKYDNWRLPYGNYP